MTPSNCVVFSDRCFTHGKGTIDIPVDHLNTLPGEQRIRETKRVRDKYKLRISLGVWKRSVNFKRNDTVLNESVSSV